MGNSGRILPAVKDTFVRKLKITKNEKEAGLWLRELGDKKIKKFFRKYKLPLKTQVFYINEVKNVKGFIENNLAKNNDIIVNYWLKPFYKERDNGHFSLVSAINGSRITLCDPSINRKPFWEAEIDKLIKSMGEQFDKHLRGFAVFTT